MRLTPWPAVRRRRARARLRSASPAAASCWRPGRRRCLGRFHGAGQRESWSRCRPRQRTDPALVREMLVAGMDCARINCAHDARTGWRAMLDNLRAAEDRDAAPGARAGRSARPETPHRALAPQATSDRKGDYLRLGSGITCYSRARRTSPAPSPAEGRSREIGCSLAEAFDGHPPWPSRLARRRQARRRRGVGRSGLDRASDHLRRGEGLEAAGGQGHQPARRRARHRSARVPQRGCPALRRGLRRHRRAVVRQPSRATCSGSTAISTGTRGRGRDDPEDRDPARIRAPAGDAAGRAWRRAASWGDDRPRRPRGGVRLRAPRGGSGGDPVALPGRARCR